MLWTLQVGTGHTNILEITWRAVHTAIIVSCVALAKYAVLTGVNCLYGVWTLEQRVCGCTVNPPHRRPALKILRRPTLSLWMLAIIKVFWCFLTVTKYCLMQKKKKNVWNECGKQIFWLILHQKTFPGYYTSSCEIRQRLLRNHVCQHG